MNKLSISQINSQVLFIFSVCGCNFLHTEGKMLANLLVGYKACFCEIKLIHVQDIYFCEKTVCIPQASFQALFSLSLTKISHTLNELITAVTLSTAKRKHRIGSAETSRGRISICGNASNNWYRPTTSRCWTITSASCSCPGIRYSLYTYVLYQYTRHDASRIAVLAVCDVCSSPVSFSSFSSKWNGTKSGAD